MSGLPSRASGDSILVSGGLARASSGDSPGSSFPAKGVVGWEGVGTVRTWQEKDVNFIVNSVEAPTDPLRGLVPHAHLVPDQGVLLVVQAVQGQLLHLQGRRLDQEIRRSRGVQCTGVQVYMLTGSVH